MESRPCAEAIHPVDPGCGGTDGRRWRFPGDTTGAGVGADAHWSEL